MFWKKQIEVIVALEIGTSKVAAAVAELRTDGSLLLLGVGESPASGVRKGEVTDFQHAQESIKAAIWDAEKKTGVEIGRVYLSITGSHIQSRTVLVKTPVEDEEVTRDHVDELYNLAFDQAIPEDHMLIHVLLQHHRTDNGMVSMHPVGMKSSALDASYHLSHGIRTRLETPCKCVMEQDIEVSGIVLSSYAAAQAVLSPEQKKLGAVVIDLGAGVTDYAVYADGALVHTGTLGLGGDHLTQDIALGLKLPYPRAEKCKIAHGDLFHSGEKEAFVVLERDASFEERKVYLESLSKIMHVRQREILELVRDDITRHDLWDLVAGPVFITGGASLVKGLDFMASKIFPAPVRLVHEFQFEGDQTYNRRPDLSTVLGLLRYAQNEEINTERPRGWRRVTESVRDLLSAMNLF